MLLAGGTYALASTVNLDVDGVSWIGNSSMVWTCDGGQYAGVSVPAANVSIVTATFQDCGPGTEVTVARASVTRTDCSFVRNTAASGGGLYVSGGGLLILGTTGIVKEIRLSPYLC